MTDRSAATLLRWPLMLPPADREYR